jgi:hypothetical protein
LQPPRVLRQLRSSSRWMTPNDLPVAAAADLGLEIVIAPGGHVADRAAALTPNERRLDALAAAKRGRCRTRGGARRCLLPTSPFIFRRTWTSAFASATSRCRDVCSFPWATSGIAIVGLDRRHDRFRLLSAHERHYWFATRSGSSTPSRSRDRVRREPSSALAPCPPVDGGSAPQRCSAQGC